jgi:hypothetical protein
MSRIVIGTSEGKQFVLPPDVITSTLVVYGGKGMGKTNFGSVLVEELSRAGLRWVAADPLGVWWGLRHDREGKGPGIECVILGGAHGDIPIEPTGGAVVADLVVDEPGNVIIDFSRRPSGEMWSVGEKVRFLTEYAKRLFQRQGSLVDGRRREPFLQILDEAARYIPQVIPHGAAQLAECVGAWETMVEEGRNIGIGVFLLTQRSARMNKSVSEVADAMFSFRIVGPNSIGAVTDWLGEHVPKDRIRQHVETLRSLERGKCLVVSPGWLQFEGIVEIRARETFDSSATPKPGERPKKVSGEAAKPDLEKYAVRMKETIERAKANDPKELRAQIVELKRELAKKPSSVPVPAIKADEKHDLRIAERAAKVATAPLLKRLYEFQRYAQRTIKQFGEAAAGLNTIANAELPPEEAPAPVLASQPRTELARTVQIPPRQVRAPRPTNGNGHGESLPVGERAILIAVAQFGEAERDQLTVLTGYKRSSRDAYVARLAQKGYLDINGGRLRPTQEGVDALGSDYAPLPTGGELYNFWRGRLPEGELRILDVLVLEANGQPISRNDLDEPTGYKRSSRDAYLSRLAARRLVETPGSGLVQAAGALFD